MKVFISHSSEDEALASKVVSYLEQAGLDVWYDGREIMPGDNWADKVAQGLRESEAMVVLVTPSALESNSLRRDIDYALTQIRFKVSCPSSPAMLSAFKAGQYLGSLTIYP